MEKLNLDVFSVPTGHKSKIPVGLLNKLKILPNKSIFSIKSKLLKMVKLYNKISILDL